ncbi:N-(5'-phosphoribosyl)anthranilate isomerase [Paragemmobacter ruber]|uniref:N-(5'-phosphoribosyl)anthranilate isomerase n=1 Tax=Paragemmobacter ruber TaxID=1985673 RepID=A0ABW9Y2A8_9RHOB|nr:N-(5'-phosphoribosyl)anthranilate isomerase [Rhodobacter ruber]NBE06094.1 N-(5'-phosphoribosyl)anthranilate isomerase [Rhodobacter ruber]
MSTVPIPITPDRWIIQLFSAKSVAEGGIIRRKVEDVERLVGRRRFLTEVNRRWFHVVENAGQFIIFCNQDPVTVLL